MNLLEVYVEIHESNKREYPVGNLLFDCGLKVQDIHFCQNGDMLYVNYPAVRGRDQRFYPSFGLKDFREDRVVKDILGEAHRLLVNSGNSSVYGYRKTACEKALLELSAEDFEWGNTQRIVDFPISTVQPLALKVSLTPVKRNEDKIAFAELSFDIGFVVFNVRVLEKQDGSIEVRFPTGAVNFPAADTDHIEKSIIEEFRILTTQKYGQQDKILNKLFQVLWNASENGYILQSRIRPILEQNGVDWKNLYNVQSISMLVKKIDFLSVRRLEIAPGHYVDWVSISSENAQASTIVTEKNTLELDSGVKELIRYALAEEYRTNGKINIASIMPYLQKNYPQLTEKLPKIKLKAILMSCEFVQFEGGPMPPIYVHILGEEPGCRPVQRKSMTIGSSKEPDNDILIGDRVGPQTLALGQEKPAAKLRPSAKSNPFSLFPDTKMIAECNIPNSGLPKITTAEASKRFYLHSRLGQLDSADLEIVYWISNLQYAKSSFLYDLIISGVIAAPAGRSISQYKLTKRLLRLYNDGLINFYRLCSLDQTGKIVGKSSYRLMMIAPYGRTNLRAIGRRSNFDFFMELDNIENILKKLSINQWFTKFLLYFRKHSSYYMRSVVTAKIAEANSARIALIVDYHGIPAFVTSVRRGTLYEMDVRSGDFAFWIQRVSNTMKYYQELYIDGNLVNFIKKPILIFICEDADHCTEIYQALCDIIVKINNKTILDSLWFVEDLDIYNDFLHSHYYFDGQGNRMAVSINEYLGSEIESSIETEKKFIDEQGLEESVRILKELNQEEQDTLQSIIIDGDTL